MTPVRITLTPQHSWHAIVGDENAYDPVQIKHNALTQHFQVAHDAGRQNGAAADEKDFRAALLRSDNPDFNKLANADWGKPEQDGIATHWRFSI